MKIGDQVRFLSETGGGRVAGFQGKNIVLVEDEDGFQIPTPVNDVVVVSGDDYSTSRIVSNRAAADKFTGKPAAGHSNHSIKSLLREGQDEDVDLTVDDQVDDEKEVTFRAPAVEERGRDKLSAYLAFVPQDIKQISVPQFDVYLVNDCNYYLQYVLMTAEGNSWTLKQQGEIEPNTQLYIKEIGREDISELNRVGVQLLAYKRDKSFVLKPTVDVQLRIDPVKFFKIHTFQDTPFFETPALLYTIVENDEPARPLVVDARQLKREMYASSADDKASAKEKNSPSKAGVRGYAAATPATSRRENLVSRYSDDQSKGNKKHSPYVRPRGLDDAVVVDLHAEELLDSTAGMSPHDILEYQLKVFRDTLADYGGNKGQKIIFIHGKGEGVLRHAIIHELTYRYKNYTYQDASFQEYGYGATQVTIR